MVSGSIIRKISALERNQKLDSSDWLDESVDPHISSSSGEFNILEESFAGDHAGMKIREG